MKFKNKNSLLIIIPTYNEKNNITELIKRIKTISDKFKILIIDDNSPDGTGNIIKGLENMFQNIYSIHNNKKRGIGFAHKQGIKWAYKNNFDTVVTMDADLTHNPKDIPYFLNQSIKFSLVVGSRFKLFNESKLSYKRKLLSITAGFFIKHFLNINFDATNGYRLYNLSKIDSITFDNVKSNNYFFFIESAFRINMKHKIKEIDILLYKRGAGETKMKLSDAFDTLKNLIKLYLNGK